ncbi:MAG: hypothetical protein AUG45_07535 [Ktedonobacter sp. 13_1_20CM_3_54_15]|nr:MAG: hypothetical protein AUH05_16940 [Ktedonobacter sp. 13_2_20CM_53_11]OLB62155.1 MAG: hypothetical protein AUH94_05275 [Ktedonobacter sp. 13_2_20CM_2_54_8]OLD80432.1 MAG: hypothetical protein AUG54_05245 [Ktedonobacter sp. 13_1_20CM_4_53_7]OLE33342.1 MAG: hypothetical protein AUG45_07535 [Ktedonobacter sp. 13_1_20CM_3_54_15]
MYIFLASDPLAMWGHIAAIILLIYLLVFILIGLALAFVLLVGMTWVREKVELIKMIRPTVNSVNKTTQAAIAGTLPEAKDDENKIIRTAAEIPAYAHEIETKVDQVSDRVASAVIEFRARSMMAKSMLKAFFLPGLAHRTQAQLEGVGFRSPGYRILIEEKASGDEVVGAGEGYAGSIKASQLKDAPVEVPISPSPGT